MKSITKLIFTLSLVAVTLSASVNENSADDYLGNNELQKSHRDERLLFFIKILPEQCNTSIATTPFGTCMEYKRCKKISGRSTTRCAKGLGTCCLDTVTCGESTSRNNSYFVNPNYPNTWPAGGSCELTVNRVNNNICQIRIDFNVFNLDQPNDNGMCEGDFMTVTGGSSSVPTLCGENAGQHIYVDVAPNGGPLKIRVDADTTAQFPRLFNMQISQIPCSSPSRAPTGCLQYFRSASGNVSSFNFPATAMAAQTSIRTPETRQISNTDYTICVRPEEGFCSITWRPDPTFAPFSFFVTGDEGVLGDAVFGVVETVITGADCTTDYVIIPDAEWTDPTGTLTSSDRFCGPSFPSSATSEIRPFNLYVHTNEAELRPDGDEGNIGFALAFRQGIC